MNCKVQVAESAERKIREFDEPIEVIAELLKAIQRDLATLDRLNGLRSVAPVRFHTHRIVFSCPVTGERRKFLTWVDDCYSTENTRIVIDAEPIRSDKAYAGMWTAKLSEGLPPRG